MSKLTDKTWELAHQAGFVLWEEEPHTTGVVDWSSNYDEELIAIVRLTARTCWEISQDDRILEHFGLMKKKTL